MGSGTPGSTDHVHHYRATCSWRGSTGGGYEAYDRSHEAGARPARADLVLSADPAFRGDAERLNPEQLLLLSAASCQLLSFLAVAARARVDVVAYVDEAEAVMPESPRPVQISEIRLHPVITVRGPVRVRRVEELVEVAHRECYVANSLRCAVHVSPLVRRVGGDGDQGSRGGGAGRQEGPPPTTTG